MSSSAMPIEQGRNVNPAIMAQVKREDVVVDCNIRELYYGTFKAVRDTQIPIKKNSITAFIGPSGCGKSTVLRCLNRMNDLVRGFRF
jgi:phosphate transport system ATP-binding protein